MSSQIIIFWHLLKTDMLIFKKRLPGEIIDNLIWVIAVSMVTTYALPLLGMTKEFGPFMATGTIVSCCAFRVNSYASAFLSDLEGNNVLSYYFTLPIATSLLFIKTIIGYALNTLSLTIFIVPSIKLVLGERLFLSNIAWIKFVFALIAVNAFFGCFSLWAASVTPSVSENMRTWGRFIFPLWYLGGSQFSWATLHKAVPTLALISLVNPMLYAMEIIHNTMLDPLQYLNFYYCMGILWIGSFICFIIAFRKLKKRLDFVV